MRASGASIARRLGAVFAGTVLIGSAYTGVAFADDGDTGGSSPSNPVSGLIDGVTGAGSSSGGSQGSSDPGTSGSSGSTGSSDPGDTGGATGSTGSTDSSSDPLLPLPTDALDPGQAVSGLLGTNAITLPSGLPTTFPTFPTGLPTIPGLPDLTGQDPTTACSTVTSTLFGLDPTGLSSALQSPAAILCGALGFQLPGLPTTSTSSSPSTEIIYAPPQYYGSGRTYTGSKYWDSGHGHRYCGCSGGSHDSTAPVTQVTTMPKGGVDTGDGTYGP